MAFCRCVRNFLGGEPCRGCVPCVGSCFASFGVCWQKAWVCSCRRDAFESHSFGVVKGHNPNLRNFVLRFGQNGLCAINLFRALQKTLFFLICEQSIEHFQMFPGANLHQFILHVALVCGVVMSCVFTMDGRKV